MPQKPAISPQELKSVTALDAEARYGYFVRRVADWEVAWGLWKNGWVLAADASGAEVFPLWPMREYAEQCATGDWADSEAAEIPIEQLLEELLPKLATKGILPAVFFTPLGQGVTVPVQRLRADLDVELQQYE